jgi:hypothetical protein
MRRIAISQAAFEAIATLTANLITSRLSGGSVGDSGRPVGRFLHRMGSFPSPT